MNQQYPNNHIKLPRGGSILVPWVPATHLPYDASKWMRIALGTPMKPSTFTIEVGEVGVDNSLEEQLHDPENWERLRDKFPRRLLTCRASKARLST